jgi:uncharacterized membrane protein YgdD (TMEM256/DUF423 family)
VRRAAGIAAAAFGAAAVALGAFGAHALRGRLDESALALWRSAVEYQFWHALALLAVGGADARQVRLRAGAVVAFVCGIVLFCGSLYLLALGAPRWLGAATPLGGLALMAGWLLTGLAFWRDAAKRHGISE